MGAGAGCALAQVPDVSVTSWKPVADCVSERPHPWSPVLEDPGPPSRPTLLSSHPIPSLSRSRCWPLCVPLSLPHTSRVGLVRAQLEEEQEGDNLCVPFTKVCLTMTIFLSQSVRDRIVYL